MLTAEELHRRGVIAMNAGKLAAATRYLTRASAAATDEALRARIEASRAYVASDSADLQDALRRCRSALDFPGLPTEVRGILQSQQAAILRRCGQPKQALETFGAAIASLEGLPWDLGTALINRGMVHLDQGRLAQADDDFTAAAHAYERAGDVVHKAKAEHNRGYVQMLLGDLVGALAAMERARPALESEGAVVRAVLAQDRAEVLLAAGLVEEGLALLNTAAADYGRRRLARRQAEAELVMSGHLRANRPIAAEQIARRARRRLRSLGADALLMRAEAARYVAAVEAGSARPSLVAEGERLAAALEEAGLPWVAATARLSTARVLTRRGDLRGARAAAESVRVRRAPLDVRLLAADVRAELAAAEGSRGEAFRQLRRGLADLHAWQSSFGSLDLQTNVAGHGVRLGQRGLALAVASRRSATLFEWSERARMLASRVQPVRAPRNEEIAAGLAELRGEVTPAREAELRARIRELAWQHDGSREVLDPVSLKELRAALGPGTALVAYVVAADVVTALVVTNERVGWHDLGPADVVSDMLGGLLPDLDMAASELPGALGEMVRGELAARLGRLGDLLVAPLVAALGDRAAVLTPSGGLAGVPWTLLPGLVGRPVTVAQSATSWLTRSATLLRTGTAGFVAGPRVARAEDEVTAAAKEWAGAQVLVREAASAAAVTELASQVDVLHVAAHGRHSAENPLFSGLQLADGPWFGYDIDQLRAVPDVVLLSACEVGRSSVRWGEELIGMTTAWLHAGARCVIASPAAVADQAAYDVLVRVHQGLAAGRAPAEALAAAIPAPSKDQPPAPFVCFG
ncbi:CHAT domain-containing protein [Nocardioides sp.]|uniref:CHAT domain-containing protein n=1 Tax=Nocardioides sp. TaxID=35761 RepID=UPI0039E436AD